MAGSRDSSAIESVLVTLAPPPAAWPLIERGKIKPVFCKTFALADARGTHELIDSGASFGKIVLTTGADLIG